MELNTVQYWGYNNTLIAVVVFNFTLKTKHSFNFTVFPPELNKKIARRNADVGIIKLCCSELAHSKWSSPKCNIRDIVDSESI